MNLIVTLAAMIYIGQVFPIFAIVLSIFVVYYYFCGES